MYLKNTLICSCEINKYFKNYTYFKNHIDDSVITSGEAIHAVAMFYEYTPKTSVMFIIFWTSVIVEQVFP